MEVGRLGIKVLVIIGFYKIIILIPISILNYTENSKKDKRTCT